MKKYSAISLAIVLAIFVAGMTSTVRAGLDEAQPAVEISKEDAAKKYPLPAGKSYPIGLPSFNANTSTGGGFFKSPYSSSVYDCRKVPTGALLLDKSVNKVFVRPKSGG
jgi:hypothetical protein